MSATIAEVLTLAQSLTTAEQQELIEQLEAGLPPGDADHDEAKPTLSEEWWRVIAQRSADFAAGRAKTVAWSEIEARWAAGG